MFRVGLDCSTLLQLDVRLRWQIPIEFPDAEVVGRDTKGPGRWDLHKALEL
jgi:hypothetical protein